MYLQESEVLRRQANWRSRSLSRHKQPKLAQLSNALRNTSENRRQRNQRVPVLCRWRMYQKSQGNGGRVSRAKQLKDHLSYGGRVTLRRYPFFMPSRSCLEDIQTQARKDKQANTGLRPSFHCVCLLGRGRSPSQLSGRRAHLEARKNKQAETLSTQGFSLLWRGRSPSRRPGAW